jgi:hypothetical protein
MCLYVRDLNPQESRQLTRVLKTSRTVTYYATCSGGGVFWSGDARSGNI